MTKATTFALLALATVASISLIALPTDAGLVDERMILGEWRWESSGEWEAHDILIFNSDGTGTHRHGGTDWEDEESFEWSIEGDTLTIIFSWSTEVSEYDFNTLYSELSLTQDGYSETLTYERQGFVCCSVCCGAVVLPLGAATVIAAAAIFGRR